MFLDIPRFDSNPIDAIGLLVSEPAPSRPPAPGRASEWQPPAGAIAPDGTAWARRVLSRSLEQRDWRHEDILGPPDVYPSHNGSNRGGWAPHHAPSGLRWIAVSFDAPRAASGIVVYESFHPGSVVRVDDGVTGDTLWDGHLPVLGADTKPLPFPCWSERGRVLRIDLPEPRTITALKLVVDTGKGCYSQIDAIGLVPAGG